MGKIRLTARAVERAVPGPTRSFLWDTELPGFGLRRDPPTARKPSGSRTYIVDFRAPDGTRRRVNVGSADVLSVEQGRTLARKALAEVVGGTDPFAARAELRDSVTVAELCALWAASKPANRKTGAPIKPKSLVIYRSAIDRHIVPLLGKVKLRALTKVDIERMKVAIATGKTATDVRTGQRGRAIVRGGSPIANRVTAYLSSILSWAVDQGHLAANPADGVKVAVANKRTRVLSDDEVEALAAALAAAEADGLHWRWTDAIRLLALTGARRNEITGLPWEEVNLERGILSLQHSKSGFKVVPLPSAARDLLARIAVRPDRHARWVFPSVRHDGPINGTALNRHWRVLRVAAGLPDEVVLHSMRHHWATAAVSNGASLHLVGRALGHADTRTTQRYAHAALDPIAAAAEIAGQAIALKLLRGDRQ